MDKILLKAVLVLSLFIKGGCDLLPEDEELSSPLGLVNKGIMSNAEVNAYRADTLEFVKQSYTRSDGTFSLSNIEYQGALYLEVTTTSQTLATCDSVTGCEGFASGLKLPGEFDSNLDGLVDFGDIRYYNNTGFLLTAFIKGMSSESNNDGTQFGEFSITPLTHIAAQKIKQIIEVNGEVTESEIDLRNAQVAEMFGLSGVDITRTVPPDVTDTNKMSTASDKQKMYSALNGAVASAAESSSQTLVEILNELTDSFLNHDGIVGNRADSDKITLAKLMALAYDIANKVETDLNVEMSLVQQKITEQENINNALNLEEYSELSENPQFILDTDFDGLSDDEELNYGTDIYNPDSDGDGLPDGWEVKYGYDPTNVDTDGNQIDDAEEDPDEDDLNNLSECNHGSNPFDIDDPYPT
jgi:hypothetical protein